MAHIADTVHPDVADALWRETLREVREREQTRALRRMLWRSVPFWLPMWIAPAAVALAYLL